MSDIRPWESEPDQVSWITEEGYRGLILRHPHFGSLNGYVGIPRGHAMYGLHYNEVDVSVHGGPTYSGEIPPRTDVFWKGEFWYIGFDTAHAGDYVPEFGRSFKNSDIAGDPLQYKDIQFVTDEVNALSRQLRNIDENTSFWGLIKIKLQHIRFVIQRKWDHYRVMKSFRSEHVK